MEKGSEKPEEMDFSTICSYCGRLLCGPGTLKRNVEGQEKQSSSGQSHGICPDCLLENFPKEYLVIQEKRRARIKNIFKKGYRKLCSHLAK